MQGATRLKLGQGVGWHLMDLERGLFWTGIRQSLGERGLMLQIGDHPGPGRELTYSWAAASELPPAVVDVWRDGSLTMLRVTPSRHSRSVPNHASDDAFGRSDHVELWCVTRHENPALSVIAKMGITNNGAEAHARWLKPPPTSTVAPPQPVWSEGAYTFPMPEQCLKQSKGYFVTDPTSNHYRAVVVAVHEENGELVRLASSREESKDWKDWAIIGGPTRPPMVDMQVGDSLGGY